MKERFLCRRVGTLTLGVVLVAAGVLGLIHLINPALIDLSLCVRFWPVVLILLGLEVILSYLFSRQERLRYDGWAMVIMICMLLFAGVMAGCEYVFEHAPPGYLWY